MSDEPDPAAAPRDSAALPATQPELDENGFDPNEYRWIPVKRRNRFDGWSDEKQRAFIEALADTGSVTEAARDVGMSVGSAYKLRRSPGGEPFAAAWNAAIRQGTMRLADKMMKRALNGVDQPVYDREGRCIGVRTQFNERLAMFLLRAHLPERYGSTRENVNSPPQAQALPTVAKALEALTPVQPEAPHLLMPPDELETALTVADIGDGRLPHWLRRGAPMAEEQFVHPRQEEIERKLEKAKRGVPIHRKRRKRRRSS